MIKQRFWKPCMAALAAAAVLTAAAASGIFYRIDCLLSDTFYQEPRATEGQVLVIGIDARALEDLGPFQSWGRDVLAMAVEELNRDPERRPAAIGLDILFSGETSPEADDYLADACREGGNVVTAAVANFTDELTINEDGTFYMDDYVVESVDHPYEELKTGTRQGHINAMYDRDGILRHSIDSILLPDGAILPSFASTIYRLYAEHMGITPNPQPPADERGRWYLPYSMLPGGYYEGYSVSDLLAGEVPPEVFEDRIVLIGPYTAGLSDYVLTAIDHAQLMYGVEYQANVIDALIQGSYKQEVPDGLQYGILFLLSLAAMLGFRKRHVLLISALWLCGTAGSIALAKAAYEQGYVLHLIYIPMALTVIYIYWVAANYISAAMDKRRVTGMFKRYVAPEIVNEILREGTDTLGLGGKLTEIAVLFVDLRGFTTMSEALPPEEVVGILNRYLTLTSSCIMGWRGTLDKFVGDCTMAIWGAPLPQEDYIYKAVRAAWDMAAGAQALNEEIIRQYGRGVGFGIGVHCGPAVVGNIGAPNRMDFTAIGDTVNTAARLEANAPSGTIYISRAVADALKGRIRTRSLGGSVRLKGKAEGFEVLVLEEILDL